MAMVFFCCQGDRKDKVLSAQPRKNAEHAVSYPPNLRTITEQQSIEEREEGDYEPLFPPNWPGGHSFPHNSTYTLPGRYLYGRGAAMDPCFFVTSWLK